MHGGEGDARVCACIDVLGVESCLCGGRGAADAKATRLMRWCGGREMTVRPVGFCEAGRTRGRACELRWSQVVPQVSSSE